MIATALVFGGGGYYAGTKHVTAQVPQRMGQRFQQSGMRNNFTGGEIIAKDDKSVTIKTRDGGSKIIFFSGTTEVGKFVTGAVTDLEIGKTITVMGAANSDGSITATSLQLRPQ